MDVYFGEASHRDHGLMANWLNQSWSHLSEPSRKAQKAIKDQEDVWDLLVFSGEEEKNWKLEEEAKRKASNNQVCSQDNNKLLHIKCNSHSRFSSCSSCSSCNNKD
eukprot:gene7200-308_t